MRTRPEEPAWANRRSEPPTTAMAATNKTDPNPFVMTNKPPLCHKDRAATPERPRGHRRPKPGASTTADTGPHGDATQHPNRPPHRPPNDHRRRAKAAAR